MDASIVDVTHMSVKKHSTIKLLHFVFRWDAGKNVGNGHFMRCSVLSKELLKRGHKVTALFKQVPDQLHTWLTNLGVSAFSISADSDGLKELSDINEFIPIDWLVIDHYDIDYQWENEARQFSYRIMVIDDLANRHHNCDLLLDQNVPNQLQKSYFNLVPNHCVQAIGLSYLLAQASFYIHSIQPKSGTLVFLGGGDHSQALSSLLKKLLKRTEYHPLKVLVTSDYLPLPYWQSIVKDIGQIHCDLVDPAVLYRSVSRAVVRCGFVSYELALLGVPSVNIHSSLVQAEVAKELECLGLGIALKELRLANSKLFDTALQQVSSMNPKPLNEQLFPGATLLAELLEKYHEYQ